MARAFTPKIVTANALIEGDVIYLTADDTWSRNHADAELITDEARAAVRLAFAEAQQDFLVGAYLADAVEGDAGPAPTHFREEFRSVGPSNYNHGKQVEQNNV
ncbi:MULTISPECIES: DUF2849 domain-containing protein [Halocynthiibacter]|uniref:DUF2849 domain-containing protein n=1 Tax=Halocynthiibacter halioticoli TaxID=2986804 RepID=A0AAE3LRJ0_9RHOB|nr:MULTISPECIES: DUF2849 domain-containing protein [Halocynthiibacter]MCV6824638.1 DUF2849 domain-containing protein [Halocynthiibacter halioticoli]MCW4057639.1 DUF2849 domain-containing protein [Halocynthiibacter sp. SDUM655004]MDE0589323.1 DUF2849 domain-containing protein [Halocynthiibacter sp. C4]